METKIAALTVACFLWLISAAAAQPLSADQQDAYSELSMELTDCYGYYQISDQCVQNSGGGTEATAQDKVLLDRVLNLVVQTGQQGGVSQPAEVARLRLTMRNMKQQIQDTCANWAILIEKYSQTCKRLVEAPQTRYLEILQGYQK